MLVVFPPIFVADTKLIYGYNFVAPLKEGLGTSMHSHVTLIEYNFLKSGLIQIYFLRSNDNFASYH